ncbi:glycoside hydrolase family 55 protein [Vibrio sp. SS-MA-C1-2]|uniref:glycoside hydrolase family 55 protein n=1 Tax=Vibrio sp. SS-MA-C1-2 TaxID=2908646 RepID=UPI001F2A9139|nr:glycoside hydrolase family 55 protein [Vibrio sp. SS-MA-C1-2]UJF17141.1 glycoside hydrolase family 55 protein [Vibrio sp. SS-MA-C1-2]
MSISRRKLLTAGTSIVALTACSKAMSDDADVVAKNNIESSFYINVLDYGAKGDGFNDDTDAFRAAFEVAKKNKKAVFVPRTTEYYLVGDVELPRGVALFSDSRERIYQPYKTDHVRGSSAIVYHRDYKRGISFAGGSTVSKLNFYGVNRSYNGVSSKTEVRGMVFIDCSMIGHKVGWGAGYFIGNSRFVRCHATMNTTGMGGMVDCKVLQAEINANKGTGISLSKGHNANNFVDCRVEWNEGANYKFYKNGTNTIVGGMSDSAGLQGISVIGAEVLATGFTIYRPGRRSQGSIQSAHVSVSDDSKLIMDGCRFRMGANDNGSGITRPDYTFTSESYKEITGLLQVIGGDASNSAVKSVIHNKKLFNNSNIQIMNLAGMNNLVTFGEEKEDEGLRFIDRSGVKLKATSSRNIDHLDLKTELPQLPVKVQIDVVNSKGEFHSAQYLYLLDNSGDIPKMRKQQMLYQTTNMDTLFGAEFVENSGKVRLSLKNKSKRNANMTVMISHV